MRAKDIAAADNNAELDPEFGRRREVSGQTFDGCLIYSETAGGR